MTELADRLEDAPTEVEQQVTPLELFFDLVFVFALTQVTGFVSADPTWTRFVEGLAILAAMWTAWESYAWLGNTTGSDEGTVRVVLLSAMGAMLIASLAVPRAFGDDGVIFGVAYLAVRVLHLGAYVIVSRADPQLRYVVLRLASTMLPASLLILVAGALDGTGQALLWVAALSLDYGGLVARGTDGWRVVAGHFSERHGLVIIIARGESIVALGVGAEGLGLGAGIIAGALLGVAVAGALWWAYFDFVSLVAARVLREAPPDEQVRIARDSYTSLHLPMVAGIVIFALGVKKTLGHVGDELEAVPAVALCGGVALYLVALSALKRRNIGSVHYPPVGGAGALGGPPPPGPGLAGRGGGGRAGAPAGGLIAYETVRYADTRDRVRHG